MSYQKYKIENLKRALIVGAGPICIELALGLVEKIQEKKTDLQKIIILEETNSVGGNISKWKFINFFSNWAFNVSELGLKALKGNNESISANYEQVKEVFPTGAEYLEKYLIPLQKFLEKTGFVTFEFNSKVIGISKRSFRKGDNISGDLRKNDSFRTITENGKNYYSDMVFDCSGAYSIDNHKWLGAGGLPAEGEKKLSNFENITYLIQDILGESSRFKDKHNVVIGSGYSAITMINSLLKVQKDNPKTKISWITRRKEKVYERFENDPLPKRDRLSELGNNIIAGKVLGINHIGNFQYLEKISKNTNNQLQLDFTHQDETESSIIGDNLLCATGYKPDNSLFQEIHVHQCWASDGPIKLAATLLGGSGDCLAQKSPGPDILKNPEPQFFILGYKSYGRNSRFLIKIGLEQIGQVLKMISN